MSRWRLVVVVGLLVVPFVILAALGSYYLWTRHLGFLAWWPLAALWALGYVLGWYWQSRRRLLPHPDFEKPPAHWTDRDKQAWHLVEARAKAAPDLPVDKLSDVNFYWSTAREMAAELANFYHPGARDPVGSLTVPEILAVIELASHDLAEMVERHLPGGHLLSINDWRRARQLVDWYNSASNIYWAVSALFSPLETAARFTATKLGLSQPLQMLQNNLILWFYTAFVHRVGTYLIDLNSGRLRVGATRYRQLLGQMAPAPAAPAAAEDGVDAAIDQVQRVSITLLGQVKAGKSSLANALLGEQRARTDVLPATAGVDRYELRTPDLPTRFVLLDTVGYAHTGPKADQVESTGEAARDSDLLLLVLHARNPARQADLDMLERLRQWFADRPDLKMPPVLAVVTHIDLLSPALEWAPPYRWQEPVRPKEVNIRDAVATVREQLGGRVAGVVPVCVAPGKVYGIEEWLLPAVAELLDEVHGVALLRCLRAEVNKDRVRRVFHQLLATGKELARITWEGLSKAPGAGGPPR